MMTVAKKFSAFNISLPFSNSSIQKDENNNSVGQCRQRCPRRKDTKDIFYCK